MKKFFVVMMMVGLMATLAQAELIDPLNTTELWDLAPGGDYTSGADGDWSNWINTQTYDTWRNRGANGPSADNWAAESDLFQTCGYRGDSGTDWSMLLTVVEGLSEGDHEVYVLFGAAIYDGTDGTHTAGTIKKDDAIRADIYGDSTTATTIYSLGLGNAIDTGIVAKTENGFTRNVMAGYMGTVHVDASGVLEILIDSQRSGGASGVPGGDRTMYFGIGIDEVPEPATMALLGLGSLVLRRRRK